MLQTAISSTGCDIRRRLISPRQANEAIPVVRPLRQSNIYAGIQLEVVRQRVNQAGVEGGDAPDIALCTQSVEVFHVTLQVAEKRVGQRDAAGVLCMVVL